MKEIKILIKDLRQYPDNFFVCSSRTPIIDKREPEQIKKFFGGLIVCDMYGEEQGFIETGCRGDVIL